MRKVLVMGGTGAMGFYLVPELVNHHWEVHVTTRSTKHRNDGQVSYLYGDAHDPRFITQVVSSGNYDAIVDFMAYQTSEFRGIHKVLEASTGHYLFVSSYRVFADTGTTPISERSPRLLDTTQDEEYLATDEYALTKARQENMLRDSGSRNWTILRPCITYSQDRFQFGTLEANTLCYRALQGIPVIMAREILSRNTTMTWAGDVARLVAALVMKDAALGEDFNVVTNEHHTWEEIAGYYKELIGLKMVESDLPTYTSVVEKPYQIKYDRLFHRIMDNRKVLNATGIAQSSFTGLKEGLSHELAAFKKAPRFQYPDLLLNARMDRAARSWISLQGLDFKDRLRYYGERFGLLRAVRKARAGMHRQRPRTSTAKTLEPTG